MGEQSSSIVLVEKMSFSDSDSDIEELSIVLDSEIEEMFKKLNFKAVAPIQRAPKERGSVYMAEQPLAGNRLLNAVGKHRKVVVKRPNGEAKVLENANAMPDGIFGRAPFKVDYRDATQERLESVQGEECIRVGSVSGSQLASTNLRRINDEIKK